MPDDPAPEGAATAPAAPAAPALSTQDVEAIAARVAETAVNSALADLDQRIEAAVAKASTALEAKIQQFAAEAPGLIGGVTTHIRDWFRKEIDMIGMGLTAEERDEKNPVASAPAAAAKP